MERSELLIEKEPIIKVESSPVKAKFIWRKVYSITIAAILVFLLSIASIVSEDLRSLTVYIAGEISPNFYLFVLGGFIAQMIDGSLGMAYGVSASTFLLSFGIPPAAASASIHTSEVFTSGVSGLMHLKFGNVNKKLFKSLLIPGIIGAATGAFVLSSLEEYNYILKPIIAVYTLYLGVLIIVKAIKGKKKKIKSNRIPPLAAFGGLMDSVGGGGWGPIVSSNLIAGGRHPRYTIGSVNLAEFFVALASSLTFFAIIGLSHIQIIIGLILGGIIAAPIAASLSKRISVKKMMFLVGGVVILVSIRILYLSIVNL